MAASVFISQCRERLSLLWEEVASLDGEGGKAEEIPSQLVEDIRSSINSKTKTYRYVLPTQLLAKCVDSDLDCRCVQKKRGGPGAFDARPVAHDVIVPFDRQEHSVLGGAAEPYLSKPLRCKEISATFREDKRDKSGWDALQRVLDAVEVAGNKDFTEAALIAVLSAIRERLKLVRISYSLPHRVSLDRATQVVDAFLSERTGGYRFESVIAALFDCLGQRFGLYASVRRSGVNAADSQSGAAGYVKCLDESGSVVAVIEAKDRGLTVRHVEDKLTALRESGIQEAFFVSSVSPGPSEGEELQGLIDTQYVAGQNIYVVAGIHQVRALIGR